MDPTTRCSKSVPTRLPGNAVEMSFCVAKQAIVSGTLVFNEDLPGWVGKWRFRWRDAEYNWEISGVNFDSAFRNAIRGVLRVVSGHDGPT